MSEDEIQLLTELRDEYLHLLSECVAKLDHCLSQLNDEQICQRPGPDQNSIANHLAHMAGNLKQWAVTGFGTEPDFRQRDAEFRDFTPQDRKRLLQELIAVLGIAASTIEKLTLEEMFRVRTIQGFDVNGLQALSHTVTHFVGHTHQIIQLTRWHLGSRYRFHWDENAPRNRVPI
ncbi:MAG: DUF1572 family protein [Planctomycetota bacterium]